MQEVLSAFAALEESQQKEHETAQRLLKCEWQLQQQVAALRAKAVDLMKKVTTLTHRLQDVDEQHEQVGFIPTGISVSALHC